jgi:hypothetical protein
VCDPGTGICSNPPKADGTACTDGDACTQTDTCQAGTCLGGNPVTCTALDQCHDAGVCDPATGACSNPPRADGTACDDGRFCTTGEACVAGACGGGAPRSCDDGNQCTADRCDEGLDACVFAAVADGETSAGPDGACGTIDDDLELFGPDGRCGTADDGGGDGLCDLIDNCPAVFNPSQSDADGDGTGGRCDATPCPAGLVLSVPDDATGLPGTTAVVPVRLSDVTGRGVLSADVTLRFNPDILTVTGVAPGSLTGGCTLTINLSAPDRAVISAFCAAPMSGSGSLAEITFDVAGGYGQGSPIRFVRGMLNEGSPAVCTDDGVFAVPALGGIAGRILYYRDSASGAEPGTSPVPGVTLALGGTAPGAPDAAITDGAGAYAFADKPLGADYQVLPGKTGDFAQAVSSFDAALNAQAVVGLLTLTPAQRLAGDVTGNGEVSSFDSALIAQHTVGLITRFPVAERLGSDWFLIPVPAAVPNQSVTPPNPAAGVQGSIAYAPLAASAAGQDFLAGLFGDVSGNYQPGSSAPAGSLLSAAVTAASGAGTASTPAGTGAGGAAAGGAPSPARLRVASGTAATGGTLRVAIMAEGAEPAVAMDLSLAFDPAILRPIAADRGEAAAAFTLTSNATVPGRIRLGLYGVRPLGGPGEIAVITFQVTGPAGGATDLTLDASLDEGRLAAVVRDGRVRVRPGR